MCLWKRHPTRTVPLLQLLKKWRLLSCGWSVCFQDFCPVLCSSGEDYGVMTASQSKISVPGHKPGNTARQWPVALQCAACMSFHMEMRTVGWPFCLASFSLNVSSLLASHFVVMALPKKAVSSFLWGSAPAQTVLKARVAPWARGWLTFVLLPHRGPILSNCYKYGFCTPVSEQQ